MPIEPQPCDAGGTGGAGSDVEQVLLCDVLPDGSIAGSALAVYEYDSDGNPTGPPTFVDPVTGLPYVAQGTLMPCPGTEASVSEFLLCDVQSDSSSVQFIRKLTQDSTGAVLQVDNLTLDGVPYAPTGTVSDCDPYTVCTPEPNLDLNADCGPGEPINISIPAGAGDSPNHVINDDPTADPLCGGTWNRPEEAQAAPFPVLETFRNSTLDQLPANTGGSPPYLQLTSGGIDPAGAGWARMSDINSTTNGFWQVGTPFPSANGITAEITFAMHDGTTPGGDGLTFTLTDGSAPAQVAAVGGGGTLGNANWLGGYLSVNFDEYGGTGFDTGMGFASNSITITRAGAGYGTPGSGIAKASVAPHQLNSVTRANPARLRVSVIVQGGVPLVSAAVDWNDGNGFVQYFDRVDASAAGPVPATMRMGINGASGGSFRDVKEARDAEANAIGLQEWRAFPITTDAIPACVTLVSVSASVDVTFASSGGDNTDPDAYFYLVNAATNTILASDRVSALSAQLGSPQTLEVSADVSPADIPNLRLYVGQDTRDDSGAYGATWDNLVIDASGAGCPTVPIRTMAISAPCPIPVTIVGGGAGDDGGGGGTTIFNAPSTFEDVPVCLDGVPGFRREVRDAAGNIVIQFLGTGGVPVDPPPANWTPGACPSGDTELLEICDLSTDPPTPFVRRATYDGSGVVVSAEDTDYLGNPYVPAGAVGRCDPCTPLVLGPVCVTSTDFPGQTLPAIAVQACDGTVSYLNQGTGDPWPNSSGPVICPPDNQAWEEILCDQGNDGHQFRRVYNLTPLGSVVSYDEELDATLYVPVGPVGVCPTGSALVVGEVCYSVPLGETAPFRATFAGNVEAPDDTFTLTDFAGSGVDVTIVSAGPAAGGATIQLNPPGNGAVTINFSQPVNLKAIQAGELDNTNQERWFGFTPPFTGVTGALVPNSPFPGAVSSSIANGNPDGDIQFNATVSSLTFTAQSVPGGLGSWLQELEFTLDIPGGFRRAAVVKCDGCTDDTVQYFDTETGLEVIAPTIIDCPASSTDCRNSTAVLLCDAPADDITTVSPAITDGTVADVGQGQFTNLPGAYTTLWTGGALNYPATAGPGQQHSMAVGRLTANPAGCDGADGELTVSVRVTQNGPGTGQAWDGALRVFRGTTLIADIPARTYAPPGWVQTLTATVPVTAADLAAGDIRVGVVLETFHGTAKAWTADQFSATVDLIGCDATSAVQFLRTVVTDCETGDVVSTTDTDLDGAPYVVTGEVGQCAPVVQTPDRGGDTEVLPLCDDGTPTPTPFLRRLTFDGTGVLTSTVDTDYSGASYVLTGDAVSCLDTSTHRDVEQTVLCDDNGPFLRVYQYGDDSGTPSGAPADYTLAGAPYVPVGTVVDCSAAQTPEALALCDIEQVPGLNGARSALNLTTLATGPTAGAFANGIGFSVDQGFAGAAGTYLITASTTQTWTFTAPAMLRFGVNNLNVGAECVTLPVGTVVESIHPNHTYNAGTRVLCNGGAAAVSDESIFTLDAATSLAIASNPGGGGQRGLVRLEAGLTTFTEVRTPFLRTICRTCGAAPVITDTALDGVTPYVPAGTVGVCDVPFTPAAEAATVLRDEEVLVLCDATPTRFLRRYNYDGATGALVSIVNTTLDGSTAFAPVGAVGVCTTAIASDFDFLSTVLCDANGTQFIQRLTFNSATGAVTATTNTTLTGGAFAPVGAVALCSNCCPVVLGNGCTNVGSGFYTAIRSTTGTISLIDSVTGAAVLAANIVPCPSDNTVRTLTAQGRVLTNATPWTPGADVAGTLTSLTVTGVNGLWDLVDSNGTALTGLPAGLSLTWSASDDNTLTGPTSVTPQAGASVVANWTQR